MTRSRFGEEQIIEVLKEQEVGIAALLLPRLAYRSEKMDSLVSRGVIEPGTSRRTGSVTIQSQPFLVASVGFYPGVLIPSQKAQTIPATKHLTVIPLPLAGHSAQRQRLGPGLRSLHLRRASGTGPVAG